MKNSQKIFWAWAKEVMTEVEEEEGDDYVDPYEEFGVSEKDFF